MQQGMRTAWVAITSGIASGVMVLVVVGYLNADRRQAAAPIAQHVDPAVQPSESNGDKALATENYAAIQDLRRRLDSLSQIKTPDVGREPSPPAKTMVETAMPLSLDLARQEELQWWRDTQAKFEQEEIDPGWAQTTSAQFESDITPIAGDKGFSVVRSECRSTRCSVILQWPSYSDATVGFADLLHHDYQTNCERSTLLPEPDDRNAQAPYRMTIIFDCSQSKAKG